MRLNERQNMQRYIINFFCTVLNSSRTRTLFFVLEFLQFCQTKKYVITRGKPEDLVKNLGDYESGFRIPRGQPCVTELTITYTIPTHTYPYTYQNPEK